ncbi:C40 family peptidase [Mycolicibacter heraklionensis]|uniref:C40 family peptidase n=1 Tax=Mycolicibacter heraklionensis TaxID=512402 RepID=A0A9X7ZEH8_9MYCO|nr:C40 family peptidase [Mycolicibacter heraklionensis]QZA07836.1 C40 family peptidase [Mycolicibacter heraklionensis]
MSNGELELLTRANELFAGHPRPVSLEPGLDRYVELLERNANTDTGAGHDRYRAAVLAQRDLLLANARTDALATTALAAVVADHARARQQTDGVVSAARADSAVSPDTPLAHREAMRRRAARLRAQHAHVASARHRARAHRAGLRRLRYRTAGRRMTGLDRLRLPNTRAGMAVRAALSRLGRPYVWGATGPDRFDCSGLTQWAYHQAGVPLSRTTYTQIYEGIPVARSQIRPGDLVFPSTGHVQLAIGGNRVIEAPHAGATVQISPLGAQVAIRRPVP